jgi:hypothetical protein
MLDLDTYKFARQKVQDIDDIVAKVNILSTDIISTKFPINSKFPIAAACLQDTNRTLTEARYALIESFAHIQKYSTTDLPKAVFFGRFFLQMILL